MANNKIQLSDGTVLLDLSNDTVTDASHIMSGRVGHLANGLQVTGTGVNCPVFTLNFDANNDITSVTCNKTFNECLTLADNGEYAAIVQESHSGDISTTYGISGYSDYDTELYILYSYIHIYTALNDILADIRYAASGIQIISPSETLGEVNTPTAAKGSVSNHSINVTPSVTYTGGWIDSGSKTGSAVTVSASELVSGNKAITSNGDNIDVTNYATVSVNVSSGGTAAISVVDTTDSHGGTVRTITGLDISDTTAVASDVASGKYFYTADGTKTTGTASSGGGSSGQTATGTVTGTGTTTLEIPCSFAPDLIYVYGDLTSSASLRGVVKFTIIKDTSITITNDTSTSNTNEVLYGSTNNVTGYGDSNTPHATYSNNVLTLDMVTDSASTRFTSGVTYTYELSTLGTGGGGGNSPTLQAKTNINPTTSSQTITADSGYDGLSSVQINAMPTGTAGTPTATKSSVSNHSITVTPSVTNTTGYITGSTINGTGVSVTASELASGNKEITSNGNNIDVVGYSTVSVNVSSTPSATQHTIYFEFADSTDTTITAYYDSTFISDAITATTPTTYGQKTVTLAQLDGVTWYEPADIPLNTQLIDFTAIRTGYIIDGDTGEEVSNGDGFASDYIVIDPTMTFTYIGYRWWDAAFYDSSKAYISGFMQEEYADSVDSNDCAHGTLTSSRIPSNAMYIRLTSYPAYNISSTIMSLIRTA